MTIRELDRLTSNTELDQTSKLLLRHVRRAIYRGKTGEAEVREFSWSVPVDGDGAAFRFQFRMRRSPRA